jgi:hypothetical protein
MEQDEHIEFDTDQQGLSNASSSGSSQFKSPSVFGRPEVSGMAAWLIKKGIISNETQAKAILMSIVVIDFVIAGIVFYFFVIK